jgi:hypothetical protein
VGTLAVIFEVKAASGYPERPRCLTLISLNFKWAGIT